VFINMRGKGAGVVGAVAACQHGVGSTAIVIIIIIMLPIKP
jgi:hypothetical protein